MKKKRSLGQSRGKWLEALLIHEHMMLGRKEEKGGLAHTQGGVVVLRQDAVLLRGASVSLLPVSLVALVTSRPFHRRSGRRRRRRRRGAVGLGRGRVLLFENVRSTVWGDGRGVESRFVQAERLLQGRGAVSERWRSVRCSAPLGKKKKSNWN